MNTQHVFLQFRQTYSECASYADKGYGSFGCAWRSHHVQFDTLFFRPDKLRFRWRHTNLPERYGSLLWDGTRVVTNLHFGEREEGNNLRLAVAGIAGLCAGANAVLGLLMEELHVNWRTLLELRDLELTTREQLDGIDCYVLQGTLFKKNDRLLWLSTRDFTMRRLDTRVMVDNDQFAGNYIYTEATFDVPERAKDFWTGEYDPESTD